MSKGRKRAWTWIGNMRNSVQVTWIGRVFIQFPYLFICKLNVFRSWAAVVTFEFVLGFFKQGINTVFQETLVATRTAVFHQHLHTHGTQALLHVRIPTAWHFLWDLKHKEDINENKPYIFFLLARLIGQHNNNVKGLVHARMKIMSRRSKPVNLHSSSEHKLSGF